MLMTEPSTTRQPKAGQLSLGDSCPALGCYQHQLPRPAGYRPVQAYFYQSR